MIQGSLWKNIFLFSVPLMFSQVLEVMFNLSDVAVVGRFADYRALGSVGSTTLLVTLFTGFLIGMGSGVNVQTAWDWEPEMKRQWIRPSIRPSCSAGLSDFWQGASAFSLRMEC